MCKKCVCKKRRIVIQFYLNYIATYLLKMGLTEEQKKLIEENRKKALAIKQEKFKAKTNSHPYKK